jgi:hypothetical protein
MPFLEASSVKLLEWVSARFSRERPDRDLQRLKPFSFPTA